MHLRHKEIDPCKVALYIRWSTDDQSDGTTLDVQLEGCRHYALSQGWTVSEVLTFIDDGYSGGNLNRPALTRLREAVQRDEVDCVVVYKLDRLSRDVPDMIRLIMEEWDGRCDIKSAREPVDTTSQSGKMFFYTLASYAEWERSVIKERTFSGKLRRAQEGKNPGQTAPYGYRLGEVKGTFDVVEHEAETVRRIFTLYRLGSGVTRIVGLLNEEQVPFREGRSWSASTIKHMLGNEVYKGDLVYGKRLVVGKKQSRQRNPNPYVVREGAIPAIVTRDEWDLVQQIRKSRPGPSNGSSGRSHSSFHLLTGMLRCGGCGRALRASSASYGTEVRYMYYVCDSKTEFGAQACGARRIRQELLDELVVSKLMELYGDEMGRRTYLEESLRDLAAEEKTVRGALSEIEASLSKHEGKRKKLRALVLEGQLSTDEYRAFVQDVKEEASLLENRRHQLLERLASLKVVRSEHVGLARTMESLDTWGKLASNERKELLRKFVDKVETYLPKDGYEVQVNITWWVPRVERETTVTLSVTTKRGRKSKPQAD